MKISILDPTGNITALVEESVLPEEQPAAAAELMARYPAVEQVGFVCFAAGADGTNAALRMAGGEFCGNASMCAAALTLLRSGRERGEVLLRVSGATEPVKVRLEKNGESAFRACVRMPGAQAVEARDFAFEGRTGSLQLVRMEGISHLLVEEDSCFFGLRDEREAAERAVRLWCRELGADGLGLMFLERGTLRLIPLVYIPGSSTCFWENSCASGSAAIGMALAARSGKTAELALTEPGGVLRVSSDPAGETWLFGSVRLITED